MLVDAIWAAFSSPRFSAATGLLTGAALAAGAAGALDDPRHAWWFALLLTLLALGLLATSIERLPRQPLAGLWVLHAGLLALALGGLADALRGFTSTVSLPQERGITSGAELREPRRLGLFVRCDDVRSGPLEADVTVLADAGGVPGTELAQATLEVGGVLRLGGLAIRLEGAERIEQGFRARIAVLDRSTGARQRRLLLSGEPLQAGDATYTVAEHAADREGRGEAARIVRAGAAGSATFWLHARDPLGQGQRKERVALAFGGLQELHAARLQISHRPGRLLELIGAALAVLGLAAAVGRVRLTWPRSRIPSSDIESSGC
jgi:hypothetical protein